MIKELAPVQTIEQSISGRVTNNRELVDEAATIILRWDANGNVTLFNKFAQSFFGFSEDEIIGRNVVGTIVPETEFTGRDLAELMKAICKDPASFEVNENENIKRNGERVWIAWRNQPLFNEAGEVVEILSVGIDITEHKRTEDALRASEESLRLLVGQSNVIFWSVDTDLRFTSSMGGGLKALDLVENQLVKQDLDLYRFFQTESNDYLPIQAHKKALNGEAVTYETVWQDRHFQSQVTPQHDNEGNIIGCIGMAVDITDRITAQKKLLESEVRQKKAQRVGRVGTWDWDPGSGELIWSDEIYRILGYKPNEVIPSYDLFIEHVHPQDRDLLRQAVEKALNDKQSYNFDCRVITRDGVEKNANAQGEVRFDDDGRPIQMLGTFQDITERKQSEQLLRESEATARALLNMPSILTLLLDQEGIILDSNVPMAKRFGMNRSKFIGKCLWDLLPPEVLKIRKRYIERTFVTGKLERWEDFRAGAWFETCANPVFDEQGTIGKVAIVAYEVTERKQAEEELKKYQDQLEALVAIRTADLQSSNEALESYSYSIAHDLRSPLRTITSYSQILKQDIGRELTGENLDNLQRIINAGLRMSQLIDEILELSRLSRCELHMGNVDLSDISSDIVKRLQAHDPGRKVDWQIQNNLKVKGDQQLLHIAMQNLIENAWKYTSKSDAPVIEIGMHQTDVGNKITYYIKDNGVGFDMDYTDKLYQPFSRLHSAADFEGTGIGLATVQRIINRHGGKVWAEAAVGKGATFYFSLSTATKDN